MSFPVIPVGPVKRLHILNTQLSKTATIVSVEPTSQGATIRTLLNELREAAEGRGITNVKIDGSLTSNSSHWFANELIGTTAGPSMLVRLRTVISQHDIVHACKKLRAYRNYDLSDAIQRITFMIKVGLFDEKNNTGIFIFVTLKYKGKPCVLSAWRYPDGQLDVKVRPVHSKHSLHMDGGTKAGCGVLVDNQNMA